MTVMCCVKCIVAIMLHLWSREACTGLPREGEKGQFGAGPRCEGHYECVARGPQCEGHYEYVARGPQCEEVGCMPTEILQCMQQLRLITHGELLSGDN